MNVTQTRNLTRDHDELVPFGENVPREHPSGRLRKTILLAEDQEDLRAVLTYFLQARGYEVVACEDAMQAAKTFRSESHLDLLLTDIEMPGKSGLELARELTTLCPDLPVLIVSGCSPSEEVLREIRIRAWTFISKPYGLPSLLAAVQSLMTTGTPEPQRYESGMRALTIQLTHQTAE